jgi:hypothetical protein
LVVTTVGLVLVLLKIDRSEPAPQGFAEPKAALNSYKK